MKREPGTPPDTSSDSPGEPLGVAIISVRAMGADASGRRPATASIQQAIDLAGASGGGVVYFPPGTYLSGGLELRSNVTICLEAGATLLGSDDFADYRVKTKVGEKWFVASGLLNGQELKNVTITGRGIIDGNGSKFKLASPSTWDLRPMNLVLVRCESIRVTGVTFRNSGCWMQVYFQCDNVVVDGITVDNFAGENNDSIDIYDSWNVRIANCLFMSDDDGITFKSCTERGCQNVTVSNCVVRTHCNAIKFGTESYGGFRNVTIGNCVLQGPPADRKLLYGYRHGSGALALECVDGGELRNVIIHQVVIDGYEVPVFLRLQDRGRDYGHVKRGIGSMRDVCISDIVASNVGIIGCSITGAPGHDIRNVCLRNISLQFRGNPAEEPSYGVHLPPLPSPVPVPEYGPEKYPDPIMYGILPAYAFFVRHVDGLSMRDIRLDHALPANRPAFELIDVKRLHQDNVDGLQAE